MLKNTKKEDLRIKKTKKALFSALPVLLNRYKFAKITVHDICTESMVSRTAFYTHFRDKYDFLGQWLTEQQKLLHIHLENKTDHQIEEILVELLLNHSTLVVNLIMDADQEQQSLLFRFLVPNIYYLNEERDAVLADFLAGGTFQVILCHMTSHRKITTEEFRKNIGYVYRMIMAIIHKHSAPVKMERYTALRQHALPV